MAGGSISPSLPWIKKLAVDALVKDYKTREEAREGIRKNRGRLLPEGLPGGPEDQEVRR